MTQRKGRSTPVVAAGAVVAVAAADVVRRRWQGRATPAAAPVFAAPQPPRPSAGPTPPPMPKHRAAAPEAMMTMADDSAAPEPVPEAVVPEPVAPEPRATESETLEPETPQADAPEPDMPEADHEATPAPMDSEQGEAPNWWHRDHPTFSALTGFFAGIAFLVVVPGLYAGILAQLVDYERAEQLFPFVLLTLIVPIVLLTIGKTRRFGLFMLIGLFSTLVVVGGVTALVLYVLFAMN